MKKIILAILAVAAGLSATAAGLDRNGNSFDDVWELIYNAAGLPPDGDPDGDGFTNLQESVAGTDPRNPASRPLLKITPLPPSLARLSWESLAGKRYQLQSRADLFSGGWTNEFSLVALGASSTTEVQASNAFSRFFRLAVEDLDSDGDGLTDYQERALALNPFSSHTDRFQESDLQRTTNGLAAASVITLSVLDPRMSERWPDPGVVAVRRNGGMAPLTVNLSLGGTATAGVDYTTTVSTNLFIPAGTREVWIEFSPVADHDDGEPTETISVSLLAGPGYTLGTNRTATIALENETDSSGPSAKEAARFLIQAAFGPDQDSPADADDIPENVEEVMAMGFEAWIEDQFARPVGKLQPFIEWARPMANSLQLYGDLKQYSWWNRAMGTPRLRPDATNVVAPDPLRQRLALALSEILVVSDRLDELKAVPEGMANYYDLLLTLSLSNYRVLLYGVAMHPCMGLYLSHVGNRKADPANHVYPDENFAREIMQLFSIGLWELNPDGTRRLDNNGAPIPTYDNHDITELARVFTGLGFGGTNTTFGLWPQDFTRPMKMWDAYHDCDAKTLLGGLRLPARTPSAGSIGAAGLADVNAAVSNLFSHPNVGPFLGRQLIQRFVTSNPGTAYVARVAAAFANNGAGVRGDMKAVIKAVLLDREARDGAMMSSPTFGKLREPFLRCVNLVRAFNGFSASGIYALDTFNLDHVQEPMKAPSVFNFFLPAHSPPGPLTEAGLVAPEFQIINASSAVTAPNYFWSAILGDLHPRSPSSATNSVRLNLAQELTMVVPPALIAQNVPNVAPFDPDPLLRRLDLVLTGGRLAPQQFQIIREALERVPRTGWQWHREYLRAAIYLVITSPEFCVMK